MLTKEVLVALSKTVDEDGFLSVIKESVLTPAVAEKMASDGLVTKKGMLTEKGIQIREQLLKRLKVLKEGVPIGKRKNVDPRKMFEFNFDWKTGTIKKQEWFMNGELFVVGKPNSALGAKIASSDLRMATPLLLRKEAANRTEEVIPYLWQVMSFGELELIWLKSTANETQICIQAMYFDYVKKRFPSGEFFAHTLDGHKGALHIKIRSKGVYGVVALIMPVGTEPRLFPQIKGEQNEAV